VSTRLARDLHPLAWWVWALGLAVAASLTTNPIALLMLVAVAGLVVACRRGDHPWSRSFRLYLMLGVFIVLIRVLFRIVFGGGDGTRVLFVLPEVPLPDWVLGIRLLGPVTLESVLAGLYDGLRLATLVICIGAANSLANPKRLLRSVPPALYEVGTALVVATSVLPQLSDSLRRVRAAHRLRGAAGGRLQVLRRLVVPVLEDALERSMRLAAGMDARGYGRAGTLTRAQRQVTGLLMLTGLAGICVGSYAMLDQTAPRWLAGPMLALGVVAAFGGLLAAGRRVQRTRYRPDRWRPGEVAVALSGVVTAAVMYAVATRDFAVAYPVLTEIPTLSLGALLGILVGALPAVVAPPPRQASASAAPTEVTSSAPELAEVSR
jgi:energy-coupling factor transport system permease protein